MSIVIRDDLSDKLDGSIGFFTIALILPLPLGPLGVVKPFPAFEDFLMLIEKVGLG
jgi:hypothetical protein